MNLSILDQAPIPSGKTPQDTLQASMQLARKAEELGYVRYWIAEHHDFSGLACSAPEVMLSYIGAHTNHIRIGCGAVLLPHYKPYKVAETYNLLSTLFPNRIDIGIGRAPGGSAEATMALSDNYLEQVRKMPEKIRELLHFLNDDFPNDHMYSKVSAAPVPTVPPEPWILGTSEKSAILAGEYGIAYVFGAFMSDKNGKEIIQTYKKHYRNKINSPKVIVTISAICAETTEKAQELALCNLIWGVQLSKGEGKEGIPTIEKAKLYPLTPEEEDKLKLKKEKMVIGNPLEVKEQLIHLKTLYNADELMIVTITHGVEDRLRSYELIANQFS